MLIGDITYYVVTYFPEHRPEPYLVRSSDFDTGLPAPRHAAYPDYLSIWRASNGSGFCALPGRYVASAASQRHLTLAEFCARYSDMGDSLIASIKAQEDA